MKKVALTQGKFAFVDDEDFELVSQFNWQLSNNRYAKAKVNGKTISMHRLILNPKSPETVDHINSNGLDNRKGNLRVCEVAENNRYRRKTGRKCSSIYKGVTFIKSNSKWKAQINFNGKYKALGRFNTEAEAAKAYDDAAKLLFGEFAKTNF